MPVLIGHGQSCRVTSPSMRPETSSAITRPTTTVNIARPSAASEAAGSPIGASMLTVIIAEIVATFLFVVIILGVTDRRAPTGFAPLAIGLALAGAHLVMIPISNASLNPARSIATAIFGGAVPLEQLWVFIVAPIVGGLIGGVFYRGVLEAKKA